MARKKSDTAKDAHLRCICCDDGAKDANGAYTLCALCELLAGTDQEAA